MMEVNAISDLVQKIDGIWHLTICMGCNVYEEEVSKMIKNKEYGSIYVCQFSYPFIQKFEPVSVAKEVIRNTTLCPCCSCLVKMMCKDPCPEFSLHTSKVKERINLVKEDVARGRQKR